MRVCVCVLGKGEEEQLWNLPLVQLCVQCYAGGGHLNAFTVSGNE